jgi:dTMP kinase
MGKLIVIEGSDASGKQTQSDLLYEYYKKENNNTFKLSFPDYESTSSSLVKMYLNGDFGKTVDSVSPEVASIFYAADRYASYKTKWEQISKDNNSIIICDRYVTSNMIHQAAKIEDFSKKEEYLKWIYNLEYGIFGLPKPNETIFLNMPPKFAQILMSERKNKITNSPKLDIHEEDLAYLEKCYENAVFVAKKYGWKEILCAKNNEIKSIERIHNEIVNIIQNVQ